MAKTSTRLSVPKMYKLFIGGKFARTESERYLEVLNPKNNEKICNISRASKKDVRNAVQAAAPGLISWSSKTGYERGQILYRLAEMLEGRKEQFIEEIILSTGASKSNAKKEVEAAIDRVIYYAGFSDKWMQLYGTVNPVQNNYFNFSIPEPVGIVAIVLPDTLSFIPLVSRICSVIASGSSCVILANEKYPLPALSFSEVIATSDVPSGTINILTGKKSELISHLCGHFDVRAVDLCTSDKELIKNVQELCALNVKRLYYFSDKHDWFSKNENNNLEQIIKFTEIKTVWHTMAY
ncbi:MAG TPA: aldehyde dehydrogenase family protein [Ignavibacteria bacterium]|nr:aldehyde dehydrogenase family protein [Ignavibacteria bacterium]